MYRIWTEEVLGFRLRGDELTIEPVLPDDWPGFELTYRHGSSVYQIKVARRAGERGMVQSIRLKEDGGRYEIAVWLPLAGARAEAAREVPVPALVGT